MIKDKEYQTKISSIESTGNALYFLLGYFLSKLEEKILNIYYSIVIIVLETFYLKSSSYYVLKIISVFLRRYQMDILSNTHL